MLDEEYLYSQLGNKLKLARKLRKLSQEQLALKIGILRTSITNIEAGRQKPPLYILYKICFVLGIEITDILPSLAEIRIPEIREISVSGVDLTQDKRKTLRALENILMK